MTATKENGLSTTYEDLVQISHEGALEDDTWHDIELLDSDLSDGLEVDVSRYYHAKGCAYIILERAFPVRWPESWLMREQLTRCSSIDHGGQ